MHYNLFFAELNIKNGQKSLLQVDRCWLFIRDVLLVIVVITPATLKTRIRTSGFMLMTVMLV